VLLIVQISVCAVAIVLAVFYHLLVTAKVKRGRVLLGFALIVVTLLGVSSYFGFGQFRFGRYMNPHDVFHYYMGSKYSKEIGYTNLYRCALVADMEGRKRYDVKSAIRDLETHGYTRVENVLIDAERYREMFSPERWEEF